MDDIGKPHLDALAQFSYRFAKGEKQPNPVLERLVELMKESYDLWPQMGADAIVSATLDSISAMYVECTSGDMEITPQATWWPNYFRTKAGLCPQYAHFIFAKGWRLNADSYMQLLP